jgi:transcriptional regulator with PAS, ATPase and Fis domain
MVDLSNLRLITAELDTTLGKDMLHPTFPTLRMEIFKTVIDKIDNYVIVVDTKLKVVMVNQKTKELLAKAIGKCVEPGDDWYKVVFGLDSPPSWDPLTRAINTRKVVIKTIESPYNKIKFNTINIPIVYNGVSGVVGIGVDDFNAD